MSKGKSASLKPAAKAAIGERIVANELTYRGFLVVNTNSGEQNSHNIDIIALKDGQRCTIQVKASSSSSHKGQYFMGMYRKTGDYFNRKPGPRADIIISVYFFSPSDYLCLILPVTDAERVCRQHGEQWMKTPKRDGQERSSKFPIYINPKSRSGDGPDIGPFIDAWHLVV